MPATPGWVRGVPGGPCATPAEAPSPSTPLSEEDPSSQRKLPHAVVWAGLLEGGRGRGDATHKQAPAVLSGLFPLGPLPPKSLGQMADGSPPWHRQPCPGPSPALCSSAAGFSSVSPGVAPPTRGRPVKQPGKAWCRWAPGGPGEEHSTDGSGWVWAPAASRSQWTGVVPEPWSSPCTGSTAWQRLQDLLNCSDPVLNPLLSHAAADRGAQSH